MHVFTFHECVSQCVQILHKYIRILDLVECKDDINRNIAKMHFDVGQEHSQNNRSIKETHESYSN